jgi:hypothetical protein
MLASLDKQLAAGSLDQHSYDARKLETDELIRKGQAFLYSPAEKIFWSVVAGLLALLGVGLAVMSGANGGGFGAIIGILMFGFGATRLVRVLRH